jgi:hypothetical protein
MPTFDRKRRRALVLLAGSPNGCTESILLAHGITAAQLASLVRDGFVTTKVERMIAGVGVGKREIEVTRMRITDAGRKALG